MSPRPKPNRGDRLICLCNGVSQIAIEAAIERGCNSMGKIFDATLAGVGPCGGTCQPTIRKMLESHSATGKFPEHPKPPTASRRQKGLQKKSNAQD